MSTIKVTIALIIALMCMISAAAVAATENSGADTGDEMGTVSSFEELKNLVGTTNIVDDGEKTTISIAGNIAVGGTIVISGNIVILSSATDGSLYRSNEFTGNIIKVADGGQLTIENLTIDGKSAGSESAVAVETGGKLIMEAGAVITNNKAGNGGGVSVNGGTFIMNGGEISGNTASGTTGKNYNSGFGAGIHVFLSSGSSEKADVTITDGVISGNTGKDGAQITIKMDEAGAGDAVDVKLKGLANSDRIVIVLDNLGSIEIGSDVSQTITVKGVTEDGDSDAISIRNAVPGQPSGESVKVSCTDKKIGIAGDASLIEIENIENIFYDESIGATFVGNYNGSEYSEKIFQSYGEVYKFPEIEPTRTGYTFAGWFSETANGVEITDASIYLTVGDVTIFAQWTPVEYTATFVGNGISSSVTFTVENTSIIEPEVPFVEGYTGVWENYVLGASDITIRAVYTANSYSAVYDADGIVGSDNVTYGYRYTVRDGVEKVGASFAGWVGSNGVTYTAGQSFWWFYTYDLTFTAAWINDPIASVLCTVSSDETEFGTVTGLGTYPAGTVVTLEAVANEGYQFISWNDGNPSSVLTFTVTDDVVCTPVFTPIVSSASDVDSDGDNDNFRLLVQGLLILLIIVGIAYVIHKR